MTQAATGTRIILMALLVAGSMAVAQDEPIATETETVASAVRTKSLDDIVGLLYAIQGACDVGGISRDRKITYIYLSDETQADGKSSMAVGLLMDPNEFITNGSKFIAAVGVPPMYQTCASCNGPRASLRR